MLEDGTTATLESAPAETAPAAEVSTTATEAAADTGASTVADVYDTAFEEHLADKPADPAAEPKPEVVVAETPTTETPKQEGTFLTDGDKQVLGRSKITPEHLKGMTRESIDSLVGSLRDQQTEQDRLRSELGRLKPKDEPAAAAKPSTPTSYGKKVDDAMSKVASSYDNEILPMGDLFKDLDGRINEVSETARALPIVMELLNELVIDQALSGLATDYPSISKPESRQKVADRFMAEWNSGAYLKNGVKFGQAIKNAAQSAAKVVFSNTTEASAAANLVKTNKDRLASQPKVGSATPPRKNMTESDVYDAAFQETIGKELAR